MQMSEQIGDGMEVQYPEFGLTGGKYEYASMNNLAM